MTTLRAALAMPLTSDGRTVVGVRRPDLAFLGGFTVFPGGAVDARDAALATEIGLDEAPPADDAGALRGDGPARVAAVRELLEETGLVVDGARLRAVSPERAAMPVDAAYRALGLSLAHAGRRLVPVARWVTPSFSSIRFDTTGFVLPVDDADPPALAHGELGALAVRRAREIADAWLRHEILLAPPTWGALEALAESGDGDLGALAERFARLDGARGQDVRYFECVPGIRGVPLLTPTLPPATHTNAYLVGTDRVAVVDPATYDDDERAVLLREIDRLGRPVDLIVLTHHHGDHVGTAEWLAERTGAPIAAHPITAELLRGRVRVTQHLHEGDVLELGSEAAPFPVYVTFTPGHARGHIVLSDRRPGARSHVVGDMVASVGTIIIDPPDGDMAEYLRQLARLRAHGPSILFPAHGMPITDGAAKLDHYAAHRLAREGKVRAALVRAAQPSTALALVPEAYADTPEALWALAERSCLAHLLKLVEDGEVTRDGEHFALA